MTKPVSGLKKSNSWLKWNLLLLLLAGMLFAFVQLQFWWNQFTPKWQGLDLSWGQIRFEQLSLHVPLAGHQNIQLEQLELVWSGWPWPFDTVRAKSFKAQLDLQLDPSAATAADTPASLPVLPLWLPQVLAFEQIEISMPCDRVNSKLSTSTKNPDCLVTGSLTYSDEHQHIQLHLANQQPVVVDAIGDVTLAIKAVLKPGTGLLQVPEFELHLSSKNLSWQQHQFSDLHLQLAGSAVWQNNSLNFNATKPLRLNAAYQHAAVKMKQLTVVAEPLQLQLEPARLDATVLQTHLQLELTQLQHQQLNTLDWKWAGALSYQHQKMQAQGQLQNNQSLRLDHTMQWQGQQLSLNWTLPELFFLAGNPLQIGPFWPELLTLQKGKVSGKGVLEFNTGTLALTKQRTGLVLTDLSGVYDRTLFHGLTTGLKLFSDGAAWTVQTGDLKVQQMNHGLTLGPVQLNAVYKTKAPHWLKGQLDLQHAQLAIFGGQVSAGKQSIDLNKETKVMLQLDKLQLAEILKQHPSADMTGQGTISGTLPLSVEQGKVTIAQGTVAALQPGGKISYQSEKARAMAQSNQGMNIVVQALENFHFSVLSANVSYSQEGQLLLALRLEGSNPDFEKGRAVNFTINLEENLPAMITSLQLSGQVSELVKKRVQQRLATQKANDARKE